MITLPRLFSLLLSLALLASCTDSRTGDLHGRPPAAPAPSTAPATNPAPAPPPPAPAQPYTNLSPEDFAELMGNPDVVLLDVRTPAEITGGKIGEAVEIDYRSPDFKQQISELNPEKTYLVYCASGGRSSKTCEMLAETGYEKLYNLRGGYSAWKGN